MADGTRTQWLRRNVAMPDKESVKHCSDSTQFYPTFSASFNFFSCSIHQTLNPPLITRSQLIQN